MLKIASRASLVAALLGGALALAAAQGSAQASPFHHGHGGWHGGPGYHLGYGFGGGWGWGGPRWRPVRVAVYGRCHTERQYDEDGYYIGRVRVCP